MRLNEGGWERKVGASGWLRLEYTCKLLLTQGGIMVTLFAAKKAEWDTNWHDIYRIFMHILNTIYRFICISFYGTIWILDGGVIVSYGVKCLGLSYDCYE